MAIPHVFLPVKQDDIQQRRFEVHKSYSVLSSDLSDGYVVRDGEYANFATPISSSKAENDPKNADGTFKHVIWRSLYHSYYRDGYDVTATLELPNPRYTYKHLDVSASLLSIPSCDFGSGVQPNSVEISSSLGRIKDDGRGNLYLVDLTGSNYIGRERTVLRVHTNQNRSDLKYGFGVSDSGSFPFNSSTFAPDVEFEYTNVKFSADDSGSFIESNGDSISWIEHRPEFNFEGEGDFTISFWLKPSSTQDISTDENVVLSKRGVAREREFGTFDVETDNLTTVKKKIIQNKVKNKLQDVYPYEIAYANNTHSNSGSLVFRNSSGGSDTFELISSGSLNEDEFNHIAITRSSNSISMYVNGAFDSSGSFSEKRYTSNNAFVTFLSQNKEFAKKFNGGIREIRFYNRAATTDEITSLASAETMYQTPIVGNVFYKTGTLVMSDPRRQFSNFFTSQVWKVDFKNTHYIYENECLCRILPGQANVTMNPSARKHPTSDELLDDFGNGASNLSPYITTIGLYNMRGELLLVGKLNQPLKTRDDVTININLKWDY
jgi:hypothetical protein